MAEILKVLPGKSFPLGATVYPNGVNFCIFSQNGSAIELLLFDTANATKPTQIIKLDPVLNKTYHYWHVFVPGIKVGQIYAYRAYGLFAPERGYRFDHTKVLLDPYARAIVGDEIYDRQAACRPGDNCGQALKGVVFDPNTYDWEEDIHPRIPYASSVIYELHVGGFTRHPNSGVSESKRGTYAGLIEKIPYLKKLGITAVGLLPVHQFDPQDAPPGLKNYWGYSTINFFSPHRGYSSRRDCFGAVDEFRDLVKALHREGIEVFLDVVFNHTAEGNHQGPTISFRGLDNQTYYILEHDPTYYSNYSGCGNTFKGNHPIVGRLILDSLRYWVSEMHVDGFRFDLASVLTRNILGQPIKEGTGSVNIISVIESDPVLAGTKLIAEAWDAAGLYGVGKFVELADWFAEWNGPFRDDVRRFVKSDHASINSLAARILASPDIYSRLDTDINRSVNFITCHDGFTLNDLVSYDRKHNLANGEENCDGANDNFSWNCGLEGATEDPQIEQLRLQQIKNFFTILFISQGTPMILMGDEVRRTQQGNNNAYCQDNQLSWFDWSLVTKHDGLLRFVKKFIHFIQGLTIFRQEKFLEVTYGSLEPHIIWHGIYLGEPDWGKDSHALAFSLNHPATGEHLHVMLNAYWQPLNFELPPLKVGNYWYRIVDTSCTAPDDFSDPETAVKIDGESYLVTARSSVVLMDRI
ncbi:glycogen debranching protein GlgX [Mastigocoleus sp. MO_188.B34]|uniref:glycogen debranching protein GlgX n=1 Tax=Mastigocoleus sp. MO_188.B34 TaxID=3036635 RepID=UPI00261427E7|nr:glycogen debranching protein GlgX [Mastigocoleus sp. MO_188.B34]MDJ0696793.1 glycogen debranching protein GlgX [Mastigocoleus sp. MO_188.B34]